MAACQWQVVAKLCMKIVHIVNNLREGGIQKFLVSLAIQQSKYGHEVSVVSVDKYENGFCNFLDQRLQDNGVCTYCLEKIRANRLSALIAIFRMMRLISKLSPDIVNSHGSMAHTIASVACYFSNATHCCTIHSAPEQWTRIEKIANHNVPLVFCSDSAFALREQYSRIMVAINNGISHEEVHSDRIYDLKKELKLNDDDRIVVLIGTQRPVKNYRFLTGIANEMAKENVHFCICGGYYNVKGEKNPDYEIIEELTTISNVHLLGLRYNISEIENGADLYMSCSLREGLPISALEAFFNGIPCVLSPIIQHKAISKGIAECYIPEEFSQESFINSIKTALANNVEHKKEAIWKERESVLQGFTIERCASEYINFYEKIR